MKTVQGIRMNSSVKRIWLTCAAVVLLLGWNLPGIQGIGWFNVPNPLIENDHLRNQSFENCVEKPFFTMVNASTHPRKVEHCSQSVTIKGAWIPSEDILYVECYGSVDLDGVQITASSKDANICHDGEIECPMLKGKLYQRHAVVYPVPCVMNKGVYEIKGYCKNQDGAIILCGKWKFTWV